MSNNYFQFKQFNVDQENCAMKVCTDSCLFGAYIAESVSQDSAIKNVLDIGTGTGLLALMIAQKNNAAIDTIEIDEKAANQAKENFKHSPWNERINIFNIDASNYLSEKKYDLIISNPPFFENDLKSDNKEKNNAKHDTGLTLMGLLNVIEKNISNNGKSAVLLPFSRLNDFENHLKSFSYHIEEKILVKQTPKHNYFRVIYIFSKKNIELKEKNIIIKDENNNYTNDFISLLKDYYLHL